MFSNWANTSSWKVIDDPTGVLSGKVLSAKNETETRLSEILLQSIGTSSAFTPNHYAICCNYAFPEDWAFASGKLEIMSRVSYSTVGEVTTITNSYFSAIDVSSGTITIGKIENSIERIIVEATLPPDIISKNQNHKFEFRTYGTTYVTLQLVVDDAILLSASDNTSTVLAAGFPAICVTSGTIYIDSFYIKIYTIDGGEPKEWDPTQIGGESGVLVFWVKADTGVTYSVADGSVSQWNDQTGLNNHLTQATATRKPRYQTGQTNGKPGIVFDGSNDFLSVAHTGPLQLRESGGSIFIVAKVNSLATGTARFLAKGSSYMIGSRSASSKALAFESYDAGTGSKLVFSDNDVIETNQFQIFGWVSNKSGLSDNKYGFWVDGSKSGSIVDNVGLDTTDPLTVGGLSTDGQPYFDGVICEIIISDSELTDANRQLIEGYYANKYGLKARLPSSHPYKVDGPTIS